MVSYSLPERQLFPGKYYYCHHGIATCVSQSNNSEPAVNVTTFGIFLGSFGGYTILAFYVAIILLACIRSNLATKEQPLWVINIIFNF